MGAPLRAAWRPSTTRAWARRGLGAGPIWTPPREGNGADLASERGSSRCSERRVDIKRRTVPAVGGSRHFSVSNATGHHHCATSELPQGKQQGFVTTAVSSKFQVERLCVGHVPPLIRKIGTAKVEQIDPSSRAWLKSCTFPCGHARASHHVCNMITLYVFTCNADWLQVSK